MNSGQFGSELNGGQDVVVVHAHLVGRNGNGKEKKKKKKKKGETKAIQLAGEGQKITAILEQEETQLKQGAQLG